MSVNGGRDESIKRDAANWLVLNTSKDIADDDLARFRDWLELDQRHRETYAEMEALWIALGSRPVLRDALERGEEPDEGSRPQRRLRSKWFAVAAGLLIPLVGIGLFYMLMPESGREQLVAETTTAEIERIRLPDGTQVIVGAESGIVASFSTSERHVLLKNGDAFFDVKPDYDRPFTVTADGTTVRAIGTSFDVRTSGQAVRISVSEGIVEVVHEHNRIRGVAPVTPDVVTVGAGKRVIAQQGKRLSSPEVFESEDPGAWSVGRLVYERSKLAHIVADADRYYEADIHIVSRELGELSVTASFRAENIPQMIDSLAASLPISIRRESNGDIYIFPRHDD